MRRSLPLLACTLLLAAVTACKKMSTGAREEFAKVHSCPEDRITVKERLDIGGFEGVNGYRYERPAPPPEVEADPGRYAKWKKDQEETEERIENGYSSYDIFEVSGCDHTDILACDRPGGSHGGTRLDEVRCKKTKGTR
jgi:hypothetical protein